MKRMWIARLLHGARLCGATAQVRIGPAGEPIGRRLRHGGKCSGIARSADEAAQGNRM